VKITVYHGNEPQEKLIQYFPCVIGRADDSEQYKDVTFKIVANPYTGVSRRHLQITEVSGQFSVTDLGSEFGTFICKQNVASDSQIAGSHPTKITDWEQLPAHEPRVLDGHTILRLGPTIRLELEPQQVPGTAPAMQ
jgi:pSer/pThr/pTyr-binding forkhead associated (FHA) protein